MYKFTKCFLVRGLFGLSLVLAVELSASATFPDGITKGISEAQVTAILGFPESTMELGSRKIVRYRLAELVFEDDRLQTGSFISETMWAQREVEKASLRHEALERRKRQEKETLAKAERWRAHQLTDPNFLKSSPESRLRYWRSLQEWCPQLDLSNEIAKSAREMEEALRKKHDSLQLAALQKKVNALEQRTRQAEQRLQNNRRVVTSNSRFQAYSFSPPLRNQILLPYQQRTGYSHGPNGCWTFQYRTGSWYPVQAARRIIILP